MRGVYYSACSLCYKTIAQFHQKCLLMRDCLLFRRLLLPESTVPRTSYIKLITVLPYGMSVYYISTWWELIYAILLVCACVLYLVGREIDMHCTYYMLQNQATASLLWQCIPTYKRFWRVNQSRLIMLLFLIKDFYFQLRILRLLNVKLIPPN